MFLTPVLLTGQYGQYGREGTALGRNQRELCMDMVRVVFDTRYRVTSIGHAVYFDGIHLDYHKRLGLQLRPPPGHRRRRHF